ncbi:protein of unknown function DUF58 [Crinalium epipsammum PCC 9333]|uniref:DUF58 domain-containing protein n=2 Tax=Crinalium TaxID=241421 RepID=K9W2R9_9CYAN|nr:protein of unknown function DUF58 [Crinalium epipsammum PCC 9333]
MLGWDLKRVEGSMGVINRITSWLETHWATPAYAGWLLLGIAICFFAAATNTMAGWLYVISGIIFAMLGLGAVLSVRSLRDLIVRRNPIPPVTVGDQLTIEVEIINQTKQPKTLLQVQDVLPFVLGKPVQISLETIPSQDAHRWIYYQPTQKRGVYRWDTVQLRTGAPLGLFWCRRFRDVPAKAFVYPTVLPLNSCPLVDQMGQDENSLYYNRDRRSHAATEGVTRALRPYRVGDPIRLIHWRTSARYGEFKVRELEVFTGGQEVIIGLDSAGVWDLEDFEQAVIAAASIYFYAGRSGLNAKLWTAATGLLWGNRVVLETLAAVNAGEDATAGDQPNLPLIWLTQNPVTLNSLSHGSRWVLWQPQSATPIKSANHNFPGISINTEQPLQVQLQQPLSNNW